MPERSRSPVGPRHLVEGSVAPSWWRAVDPRRVLVAGLLSFASLPLLAIDDLTSGSAEAEAVETAATSTTAIAVRVTTTSTTATTAPPGTAPPTTAPTTAPPTTAAPTAPPTTAARRVAPTTAPATTAPPTTAAPVAAPPPTAGSVEATIRSWFPDVGDQAVAVARCESGLNPSAQSPSGYRGLFQLSPSHASTFAAVTGRDFEDAWDEPGPNSQYARYLYERDGWAPWGACAP